MIKPIDKITSLVSNDLVSLFGDDVINNAFEESWKTTLGILTDESVYDSIVNSDLPSRAYSVENTQGLSIFLENNFLKNKRLISVERLLANTTNYYPAKTLDSLKALNLALNPDSIHYENNKFLPQDSTTIGEETTYAHPKGRVYWINMLKFNENSGIYGTFNLLGKDFSSIDALAEHTIFYGIPDDAKELVYMQTAINLIQNYMADFVYEEEDTELTTLLASQMAALNASKQEQFKYVLAKYGGDVQLNE